MPRILEALWTAQFQVQQGWVNGGVVVFETQRVYGGDSSFYYVGTYEADASSIRADLKVVYYQGEARTAWGDQAREIKVHVDGKWSDDQTIKGVMSRADQPNNLNVVLKKRENLP